MSILPKFVICSPAWAALPAAATIRYVTWRKQIDPETGEAVNGALQLKAAARDVVVLEACGFIAKTSPAQADVRGVLRAHYRMTDLPWREPHGSAGPVYPPSPAFMGHRSESEARAAIRDALAQRKRQRKSRKGSVAPP